MQELAAHIHQDVVTCDFHAIKDQLDDMESSLFQNSKISLFLTQRSNEIFKDQMNYSGFSSIQNNSFDLCNGYSCTTKSNEISWILEYPNPNILFDLSSIWKPLFKAARYPKIE